MTTPDPSAAAPAAAASDPAAAAAAAASAPTHASQQEPIGYKAPSGDPAAAAAPNGDPAAPAAPDGAAMRAYLADKAKDVSLEGKSEEDVAKLYTETKAKEPAPAEFKLPDEYKDKPWAAKVKSIDDVYKQIDTLDTLKGKKSIIPNLKDASAEEREAFYAQLRGKDAAEYVIPVNEAFPTPAETQPVVAKLFMDNGVSPTQAEAIIKGYQELGAKQLNEQFNPDGFKKSMETAFGADWEKTTGAVRNTISSMMSPEDAKALDNIPNHMLGTIYRTLGNTIKAVDETLKKYGAKETFAHLSAPNGSAKGGDLVAERQAIRTEMTALSMRPHEAAEHEALSQRLADTYTNDPRLKDMA